MAFSIVEVKTGNYQFTNSSKTEREREREMEDMPPDNFCVTPYYSKSRPYKQYVNRNGRRAEMLPNLGAQPMIYKASRYNRRQSTNFPVRAFVPGRDRTVGNYERTLPGTEEKNKDVHIANTQVLTDGNIFNGGSFLQIQQGNEVNMRVGRKLLVKKFQTRICLVLDTELGLGNYPQGDVVRIIVYQDKQTNGAAAAVLSILDTAVWDSYRNLSETNRFKILTDKTYDVNYLVGSRVGGEFDLGGVCIQDQYISKMAMPVEYSLTSGEIGTIRSNNIGILAISKTGVAKLSLSTRARFSDA